MPDAVGRPKLKNPRCKTIQFRVSEREYVEIENAAQRWKESVTELCRDAILDLSCGINAGELD